MTNRGNSQYSINNFQRVELDIGNNVDQSSGLYLPTHEGTSLYIERCDYPALIALGSNTGGLGNSIVMRDGLSIDSQFSGICISYPALNAPAGLSFIICKNGADYRNEFANPVSRLNSLWRVITNTPTQGTIGVFIPPGTRSLVNFQVGILGTTASLPSIQFYDATGTVIQNATTVSQNIGGATVVYNAAQYSVSASSIVTTANGFVAFFNNIPIPTKAVEARITINGAGLTGESVAGNYQ
jgi:hypothetical protein